MSPALRLAPGGGDRLAECVEVFRGSAIWERYFAGGDRLQRSLERAARQGQLWYALTDENAIAGVMRVVPGGFCGLYHYLSLLGAAPWAHGQGVGRFLMGEFERMAREAGCARTSLLVSDFNAGALAFYRSLGYWELGVLPDAAKPGIAERVLLKDLNAGEV